MTTVREYCEKGNIQPYVKEYWKAMKGQIPLCCYKMKMDEEILITCTWLKKWYSLDEFRKLCLDCQEQIEKLINI